MARPPGPSSSSGFESSIRGSAATAAASPQDAARATLAVARDAGVDLEPACSLRRQLLPCAVPSRRSFDGLDVADGAVRLPSVRLSRPHHAGCALRSRGRWPPGPARHGWPRPRSRNGPRLFLDLTRVTDPESSLR